MSRRAPRPLSLALGALSESLEPLTPLARVQRAWEQAAGPAVAAVAQPVSEREGTLTVICEAAVWAQELELMSGVLVERLNGLLGEGTVRALRCRTGQL